MHVAIGKEVEELNESVDLLVSALECVLKPKHECKEDCAEEPIAEVSPLRQRIRDVHCGVANASGRIRDVVERLDL